MSQDKNEFLEIDQDLRRIGSSTESNNLLPLCPYGRRCTRKNPIHFKEYRHPSSVSSVVSTPENNKKRINKPKNGGGIGPEKTPKKCSLPFEKSKSSMITNYFKRKSDNNKSGDDDIQTVEKKNEEEDITSSKIKVSEENPFKKKEEEDNKKMGESDYLLDDSDIDIDEDEIAEINLNRFGKRSLETSKNNGRSSKSLKKVAKNNDNDADDDPFCFDNPKSNNFNRLIPNIDKILSKPDNLIPISPLDIPSSSSSEQSLSSPMKVLPTPNSSSSSFYMKMMPSQSKNLKLRTNQQFNDLIRKIFLVKMPEDFFTFWKFCKEISPRNPEDALVDSLGLKLVGPFDVLNGKLDESNIICNSGEVDEEDENDDEDEDNEQDDSILTHWRFYYDPPELQTFAISTKVWELSKDHKLSILYHLGYFRDNPNDTDPVVVSNDPEQSPSCEINGIGDNIFVAIQNELSKRSKSKDILPSLLEKLNRLESKLKSFAERNKINLKANEKLRKRKRKCNAPTLNRFGIVVPMIKDVGYRELPHTDDKLRRMFQKIINLEDDSSRRNSPQLSEIQRIVTLINYANDEKDFGMGLEFGIDLFCAGHSFFHRSCLHLLELAYKLLERNAFGRILKAHLENRREKPLEDKDAESIVNLSAI